MRTKTIKQTLTEQELEDYEYAICLQESYDNIIYELDCRENEKKYGYSMDDKELRDFIDNCYFELHDNYERYGIEDLYNFQIKEDEEGKYIVFDVDGEYFYKEYLKEQPEKLMSLQEIAKRNIIKKTSNLEKKMKLLEPRVYNNVRDFYLTVES